MQRFLYVVAAVALVSACDQNDAQRAAELKFDSSIATLMDFEFDGAVDTDSNVNPSQTVMGQLLYTIGQLNEKNSVGRLDALELTNVVQTASADGKGYHITYHAKLPVAWGSKTDLPSSYELKLPRNMQNEAIEAFTSKYMSSCLESGAHDVDSGSFWYYYRPGISACRLDAADIVKANATVVTSHLNSRGKYPEYDQVWEKDDNALKVVAIFGKYEDGSKSKSDAGIAGYQAFVSQLRAIKGLTEVKVETKKNVFNDEGADNMTSETIFTAKKDGKSVEIVAMLVDNVRITNKTFSEHYNQKSADADIIMYNGHAGLGDNVRALARKGQFKANKYQMMFMNGCDTFAYVDGYMAKVRAEINPEDAAGTKYMDILTNAMPSYFHSMPDASMALINALLDRDHPKTYREIFDDIDESEVVLVTGEEDNVFKP